MGVFVIGAVTSLLPKMIGPQRAKELMLFGEPFDAHQALKVGIARKVVPEDTLFDEAEATARRIIELPEGAVRNLNSPLKKALLTGFHSTAKHIAAKAVSPSSETMRTI